MAMGARRPSFDPRPSAHGSPFPDRRKIMSDRVAALEAELALAKAEAGFLKAKADNAAGKLSTDKYHKIKLAFHAQRTEYRVDHRGEPGGTAVAPASVKASAVVG